EIEPAPIACYPLEHRLELSRLADVARHDHARPKSFGERPDERFRLGVEIGRSDLGAGGAESAGAVKAIECSLAMPTTRQRLPASGVGESGMNGLLDWCS